MSVQGLQVLSEGTSPIVADVIFVHGLRGDPLGTWTSSKVCWPRDLLNSDAENARISTWGYDSGVAYVNEFSSQNSIFSHAENLLNDVARLRRRTPTLPLIFVGHSLGGLVIKEALIRSSEYLNNGQDLRLGAIYKETLGVVFLGTPHRGSDKAGLAEIVGRIAKATLRQPNKVLLRTLEEDSDVLERQRRSFASISESLQLACLFEEKPMSIGMIVPERSACIDGFRVKTASIPKDHSEMCKYSDRNDIGYQRTLDYILDFLEHAQNLKTSSDNAEAKNIVDIVKASEDMVLSSLSFPGINEREEEIPTAFKKTFGWVYDDAEPGGFLNWLSHGSGIFWINGKAASGKSTLMKFILSDDNLRRHLELSAPGSQHVVASFFFHDRGTPIQKSYDGLLRSILYQVASQSRYLISVLFPDLWRLVHDEWKGIRSRGHVIDWTRNHLLHAFQKLLSHTSTDLKLFLLIDGLDEYSGNKIVLADVLKAATTLTSDDPSPNIKLFLSSRPLNEFEEAFEMCPKIKLEEHTYGDIQLYVSSMFRNNRQMIYLRDTSPKDARKLVQDIVQKASGVFLWVRIVVDSLLEGLRNQDSMDDLKRRLQEFPAELEPLYTRMLENIPQRYLVQASHAFQIAQAAQEPLPTLALWYSDEVRPPTTNPTDGLSLEELIHRCSQVDARLRSRCAGLLEIRFREVGDKDVTRQVTTTGIQPTTQQRIEKISNETGNLDSGVESIAHGRTKPINELVRSRVHFLHLTVKEYLFKSETWSKICQLTLHSPFDAEVWLVRTYLGQVRSSFDKFRQYELWGNVDLCVYHAREAERTTGKPQTASLNELDEFMSQSPIKKFLLHLFETSVTSFTGNSAEAHWTEFRIHHERTFGRTFSGNTMLSFTISARAYLYSLHILKGDKISKSDKPGNLLHLAMPSVLDDLGAEHQTAQHLELVTILIQMGANVNEKLEVVFPRPVSAWQLALLGVWNRSLTRPFNATSFDFQLIATLIEHGADPDARVTIEGENCTALDLVTDLCHGIPEAISFLTTLKERHTRHEQAMKLAERPEDEQSTFEANLAKGAGRSSLENLGGFIVKIKGLNAEVDSDDGKKTRKRDALRRFWRSSQG